MAYPPSTAIKLHAPLLRQLIRLTEAAADRLLEARQRSVPDRILVAFLRKGSDGLRAVLLLQKDGLCHEAQSLARSLFELRLSFDAFLEFLRADPRAACARVIDAVMIEKVKQARASEFKGLDLIPGAPTPQELENREAEISSRYSEQEFKKLKQHGFTGMNVEQRAKQSGLSDEYNIIYRNFSRNVHATDFTELLLQEDPALIGSDRSASYFEQRDTICSEIAFTSVAGITIRVNALTHLGLDRRIETLRKAQEQARQAQARSRMHRR